MYSGRSTICNNDSIEDVDVDEELEKAIAMSKEKASLYEEQSKQSTFRNDYEAHSTASTSAILVDGIAIHHGEDTSDGSGCTVFPVVEEDVNTKQIEQVTESKSESASSTLDVEVEEMKPERGCIISEEPNFEDQGSVIIASIVNKILQRVVVEDSGDNE